MNTSNKNEKINKRQEEQKKIFLENLRKYRTITAACKATGISSRMTYYRWIESDSIFAAEAEKAKNEAKEEINDLALSRLTVKINEGNLDAIKFQLRHCHPDYRPQNNPIVYNIQTRPKELSPEHQKAVEKILHFVQEDENS